MKTGEFIPVLILMFALSMFTAESEQPAPEPVEVVALQAPKPEEHKPEPYVEPVNDVVDDLRVTPNKPADFDAVHELYQKVIDYQSGGGRQWEYRVNGRLANREQLLQHIASEHSEISRDELSRFNTNTLRWIHGYYHTHEKHLQTGRPRYEWRRVKVCTTDGCRYEWRRVRVD